MKKRIILTIFISTLAIILLVLSRYYAPSLAAEAAIMQSQDSIETYAQANATSSLFLNLGWLTVLTYWLVIGFIWMPLVAQTIRKETKQ